MRSLTDNEIDFIFADLEKRGLTIPGLQEEITDHICCIIEPDLEKGIAFQIAYNAFVNKLEENTFRDIQNLTILSTNLKFQRMKKTMFIIGIIGSVMILTGAYFKSTLAGGGALSIGLLLIVFGFLPLFFYTAYKERREKKNILLDLSGYLTVTLFILSVLFANQHWPGASLARTLSLLIAIFGFTPLYMVTVFRKSSETKTASGYLIVIFLIAIGGLYIASSGKMANSTINSYSQGYLEANRKFIIIKEQNDSLYKELIKQVGFQSDVADKINDMRKASSILTYKTDNLQNEMVKMADGESATITSFTSLSDRKVFYKVLAGDKKNSNVSNEVLAFKRIAKNLCPNPADQNIIEENMNTNYLLAYYLNAESKNIPLITGLLYLANFKLHVEMAEYHVLKTIIN